MLLVSYFPRCGLVRALPVLAGIVLLLAAGCRSDEASSSPDRPAATHDTASARTGGRAAAPQDTLTVLVFGNSLAAGYGVEQEQAFPALLQQKADSAGFANVDVVNAGNSGETTAGGRRRIDWLLRRDDVDVLLLELGGNDALRGLSPDSARANLRSIIEKTKTRFPEVRVVLAGMQAPPNMGNAYTERFEALYPALAEETDARLVPFLLKDVAGNPELNQPDGIHPTAAGHRILAANVWETLAPVLREMRPQARPAASTS